MHTYLLTQPHTHTLIFSLQYSSHEGPRKCFNAAKSWKAGWYSDYHIDLEVSDLPWSGKLSSFTNPAVLTEPDSPDRDNLVIRFDKDTYLMWNRADGMNEGTQEK